MSFERVILNVCLAMLLAVCMLRLKGLVQFGRIRHRDRNKISTTAINEGCLFASIIAATVFVCGLAGFIWIYWF